MKVTTSCSGRFHIFDQARQLHRKNVLHKLINDYPKFMTRRWGVPDDKVISLIGNGTLGRLARVSGRYVTSEMHSSLVRWTHSKFSRRLSRYVPIDSDVFIGLSSFCLEAIDKAKELGIMTIVDHGSFHQRTERRLLKEEAEKFSLFMPDQIAADWIIQKEDKEFQLADFVMVLSEAAKRSLANEGIRQEKIFVNSCGVDVETFSPGKKIDSVFRIIFCGASSPRKGIWYLLKAFAELNLPRSELWIIGSPPSIEFRKILSPFLQSNVMFMGSVPQLRLRDLYCQSSLFILPSIADGFGMVVTQAMACGLPVIVSANVGAADIVTHGVDGFILPIRDVDAIKEAILELYDNPERLFVMAAAAVQKTKGGLSWDFYGDRLVEMMEKSLQCKRP
jgi:glycosyltransferase involved in cell wall biosynthesis